MQINVPLQKGASRGRVDKALSGWDFLAVFEYKSRLFIRNDTSDLLRLSLVRKNWTAIDISSASPHSFRQQMGQSSNLKLVENFPGSSSECKECKNIAY